MMDKDITTGDELNEALLHIIKPKVLFGTAEGTVSTECDHPVELSTKDVEKAMAILEFSRKMIWHMPFLHEGNIGNDLAEMLAKKRVIGNN